MIYVITGGVKILVGMGGWFKMFLLDVAFIISRGGKKWEKEMGNSRLAAFHKPPTLGQ